MTMVRTTFNPDLDVEVNDAELLDLQRDGLIVESEAPAAPVDPAAAADAARAAKAASSPSPAPREDPATTSAPVPITVKEGA